MPHITIFKVGFFSENSISPSSTILIFISIYLINLYVPLSYEVFQLPSKLENIHELGIRGIGKSKTLPVSISHV